MFDTLLDLCAADPGRAAIPAIFLAGLVGGVAHCGPMCGPFVLGQMADRVARLPAGALCEAQRLSAALLLPYHAGRLLTYMLLGAAAAGLGGRLLPPRAAAVALALASLLFLLRGLHGLAPGWRLLPGGGALPFWARRIARAARRIERGSPRGAFLLGLVLGLLPCGFLYTALVAATATGSAAWGAATMLAFGLGTLPTLVGVAWLGHAATRRWQRGTRLALPVISLANAAVLGAIAWAAAA